jgi:hypothetical protein
MRKRTKISDSKMKGQHPTTPKTAFTTTETTPLVDGGTVYTTTGDKNKAETHKQAHLKKYSLLHFIFAIQTLFTCSAIYGSFRDQVISFRDACVFALDPLLLIFLMIGCSYLGSSRQFFQRESILQSFPIFWLPAFAAAAPLLIFGSRPAALKAFLDHLSPWSLVGLQAIRFLAVGSLIKWYLGVFPWAFACLTAFPDMLFGLSAAYLSMAQPAEWFETDKGLYTFLAVWNLLGFSIIAPVGAIVLQLGMLPTKFYHSTVPNAAVFEYPMVLGPAIVVPTLLSWNIIVAMWALQKRNE